MIHSFFNELQSLYEKIDKKITEHYSANQEFSKLQPCRKGCDSCCHQFFEISEGEALYIVKYLDTLPIEIKESIQQKIVHAYGDFVKNNRGFYERFFKNASSEPFDADLYFNDDTRFSIRIPCPCLDDSGSCQIYAARPLICRTTGSGYTTTEDLGEICEIIPSSIAAKYWQVDLEEFQDAIWSTNELINPNDPDQILELRQFPLFYYLFDLICDPTSHNPTTLKKLIDDYDSLPRHELEKKLFNMLIL